MASGLRRLAGLCNVLADPSSMARGFLPAQDVCMCVCVLAYMQVVCVCALMSVHLLSKLSVSTV